MFPLSCRPLGLLPRGDMRLSAVTFQDFLKGEELQVLLCAALVSEALSDVFKSRKSLLVQVPRDVEVVVDPREDIGSLKIP